MLVNRRVLDDALRDHRLDGAFEVREDDIPGVRVGTGIGAERGDVDHVVLDCRVGPADEQRDRGDGRCDQGILLVVFSPSLTISVDQGMVDAIHGYHDKTQG